MPQDEEQDIPVIDDASVDPLPEEDMPVEEAPAEDRDVITLDDEAVQPLPDVAPAAPTVQAGPAMGAWDALPLLGAQGATLGTREELLGAGAGIGAGIGALPQGPGAAFLAAKQKYEQTRNAETAKTKLAREQYPVSGFLAEMAGGLVAPFGAAKTFGSGLRGAIGAGATAGAISGAGEAAPGERIQGGLIGGVTGGALGGVVSGVPKLLTSGVVASGAGILAPGLDTPFYAELLRDPAMRQRTLAAKGKYPDIAAAGEEVGGLFDDVIQGVRGKSVASKEAGDQSLIQQGYLGKPMDNAVKYMERTLGFVEAPENAHSYSPQFKETLARAYQNLKGYFPAANQASGKIARVSALENTVSDLTAQLQKASSSPNKSFLMQKRIANLSTELADAKAQLAPMKQETDSLLIQGYHEARKDLDSIIYWNDRSNVPQPSRADQEKAKEVRSYIDGILKTSPDWRAHDELYAAWAPLEKQLQRHIDEAGGTGNVSYKKVWNLLTGAGGEGDAANKAKLLADFEEYVTKHFSGDPVLMDRFQKFRSMADDLTLSKKYTGMGAATGMSTGRMGAMIKDPTRAIGAPVLFPTVFLQALDKANSAKEFLQKISPNLPTEIRNRVLIMGNQALKQKPGMTTEEMGQLIQSQTQENKGE